MVNRTKRLCLLAAMVAMVASAQGQKKAPDGAVIMALPSILSMSAVPSSITFVSNDPDVVNLAPIPATVQVTIDNGQPNRRWRLLAQATSATLTGCSAIQTSAVRLSCTSTSVTEKNPNSGLGNGSAACSAAISLSTTPQPVATGGMGNNDRTYTANLSVGFADSWRYPASTGSSCSVNITYTYEVQP
jgi:hypothetical protein